MRILAPILTGLVLLHKTCGIWNSSPSSFAWALPSKIVKWEGFCGREWYLMCVCFGICFFGGSDILNDLKDMRQIPSPWLSYFVPFLSPFPCWALKALRIIFLNIWTLPFFLHLNPLFPSFPLCFSVPFIMDMVWYLEWGRPWSAR